LEKVFCKIEIDDFRSVVRVSFGAHIQRGASNKHARSLGPKPQLPGDHPGRQAGVVLGFEIGGISD
jgi:hypothetical protein